MADDETKILLEKWQLSGLVGRFQENNITSQTLQLLSESDIENLVTSIGDRAVFRENLMDWRRSLEAAKPNKVHNPYDLVDEDDILDISDRVVTAFLGNQNTSSLAATSTQPSSTSDAQTSPLKNYFPFVTDSTQRILTTTSVGTDFVEKLLHESVEGRGILACGIQNNGLLNESQRRELGRLIIRKVLDDNPTVRIQGVTFTRLSLQITSVFIKETPALYFTSAITANKFQQKRNASGILYEAYITRRRKLRQLGELPGRVRSRSTSSAGCNSSSIPLEPADATFSELQDNPVLENHVKWLENSVEPWSLVELYWTETAQYRIRCLEHEKGNIHQYFHKYPALKQPEGYRLLLRDFDREYPDLENRLFHTLVLQKDSLIKIATERKRISRDAGFRTQVQEYLNSLSEPGADIALLLLIPYILNVSTALKKPGKPIWKPSRSETRDAFVTQVASEADILPTINERKNKYEKLGRTFQPLVVLVGLTLTEIVKSVVVVDQTIYIFPSPLEAVDAAFKITHATGACYQDEAAEVWLFIQRAFYKITTHYDRLSQTIKHLLTNLGIPF